MDSKATPMRARRMAELLPGIKSILSKEAILLLSSQKKPNVSNINTNPPQLARNIKPMTIAEILALTGPSSKKVNCQPASAKAKTWNSSVKVNKAKPVTTDNQQKFHTVRKTLNFHQKPTVNNRATPIENNRATLIVNNRATPTVNNRTTTVPIARKSIHPQVKAKGNSFNRISGVCKIPDTPLLMKPPLNRVVKFKNISFKSNDDSFLQKEKEINDFETKSNALIEEHTLERIDEISPPVSTPFHDYRNVRDYFDHSEAENSVLWNNNTVMSFDKPSEIIDNSKREESVIVSLCEQLNKATVTSTNDDNQNISDLNEFEQQMENDLKVIDNVIVMLNGIKEKKLKSLQHIRKLKQDKQERDKPKICNGTTLKNENIAIETKGDEKADTIKTEIATVKKEIISPDRNPIDRPTVIKSRSPTYKIPRKSICLRKKVFHKSMPNISDVTPNKSADKALNMYMQIKKQMSFLSTPLSKPRSDTPDTPALTSRNLQSQLDKLYNDI